MQHARKMIWVPSHDESVLYTTKNVTINCTKAQKKKFLDLVTLIFLQCTSCYFPCLITKKLGIIKVPNEVINKDS